MTTLTTLAALTLPTSAIAQHGLPAVQPNAKTLKLSDLAPEVASQIKAQHYAAQDHNIQQAYHQQLQTNQQRAALSAHQAAFEKAAFDRPTVGTFAPTAYQAPVAPATPVSATISAPSSTFPRTAAAPPSAPAAGYTAPQTFMPPVHIPPPQHYYTPGVQSRSINGRRNAVQNFAPQTTQRHAADTAYRRPVPRLQKNEDLVQPQRRTGQRKPKEDTHVFLQERISNALSRHFKRGSDVAETEQMPQQIAAAEKADVEEVHSVIESSPVATPEISEPTEIVFGNRSPAPLQTKLSDSTDAVHEKFVDDYSYSEILNSNQYASRIQGNLVPSADRPNDHPLPSKSKARRRSIERAVHHDHVDDEHESFEVSIGNDNATIFDRYESIRQTSGQHEHDHAPVAVRRSIKKRAHVAALSRPDNFRTKNRIPADNISILLQDGDDENPSISGSEDFSPQGDFDDDFGRDRNFGADDRPNLRDDLRDADEGMDRNQRKLRDRVRSRLDDDLDLEGLDRALEDEMDAEDIENDRPSRAPRKTCREFQDELLAGSIRDISLDISPPAASVEAQYGGLARTWTDRRGNILATGALVDLRRGYVILDSGQKLAYARLSEADLAAVSDFWRLPEVCLIGNRGGSPYRSWTPQVVTWKASNLCHKPLYFENIQLERYGHSRGPIAQPIHSTLHFFTRLVALPYMTGICPPNECEYALGYFRPGNCAPWLKEPVPISLQGIRREALFVTGAAFVP